MIKLSLYLLIPFVIVLLLLLFNTHYKWMTQKDIKELQRDIETDPSILWIFVLAFILWPLTIIVILIILFYQILPAFFPKDKDEEPKKKDEN